MPKRLHMICNAHIDPEWQWEWEEGAAETLSTFRIAADFCEEYGDFVFCHNEALLYKWIEEYEPCLFEKIVKLVSEGKWHIMGGWHLQPDCNMPSGEAMVRQILDGRMYFKTKFNVTPTTAVNLDPFGHSRGLVQIMAKSGYDSYLFMRPSPTECPLDNEDFTWVGYDGSKLSASRIHGGYNSPKGKAAEKIKSYVDACKEDDIFLCLWGIGNHGGGPSKKDLEDITELKKTLGDKVELIHSTPENYFDELKKRRALPEYAKDLNSFAPGCYTSLIRIKQKYRQTENTLFMTEKICSHAANAGLMEYPSKELDEARYDMLTMQFHDALPGSSIQPVEEMAMRTLDHALENLSRVKAKAFFALCKGQKKAQPDAIPVIVYNPYPYEIEGDLECGFMLWDQNWNDEFLDPVVYEGDIRLPSQCEKEESTIPLQWRKRVTFHAKLKPMQVNRFDCKFDVLPKKPVPSMPVSTTHFVFDNEHEHIEINRLTGLVDVYKVDGKNVLKKDSFTLNVYKDNFDPWGMTQQSWTEIIGKFSLLSDEEGTKFSCVDEVIPSIRVIEDGSVRTIVEALFGYENSRAVVHYVLSKKEGMRIDLRISWNEKQKMVKMMIPAAFKTNKCFGEQMYGMDELRGNKWESCAQKFQILEGDDLSLSLCNNCTYGCSYDDENDILNITVLRSPSYTAHPLPGRKVMPQDRFLPYAEQGERLYSFSFNAGAPDSIRIKTPRRAQEFNETPMTLSFYPTGLGEVPESGLELTDSDCIEMTAVKKASVGDGYIVRLFNPTNESQSARLSGFGITTRISLSPFEIKTLRIHDGAVEVTDLMEGLLSE